LSPPERGDELNDIKAAYIPIDDRWAVAHIVPLVEVLWAKSLRS
jgi:hypothetical protein